MAKVGKPTQYTLEIAQKIADKISSEYKSLDLLHKENPQWFPCPETVLEWRVKHKEFGHLYLDAKRAQAELGAEMLKKVSEKAYGYTYVDDKGNVKVDPGAIAAAKLESDNIRWATGRLARALYGDQMQHEHTIKMHEQWLDALKD